VPALVVDGARVRSAALWILRSQCHAADLAQPARPVHPGVAGDVGLVHRDRRRVVDRGTEDERAGQVDQIGAVAGQRGPEAPAGQADAETAVAGHRHRADPDYRARERPVRAGRAGGRRRRDDQRLMAARHKMFRDPEGAVRHPVHIGREGLRDDHYPHVHQGEHTRYRNRT
jgi:hypothetical protein